MKKIEKIEATKKPEQPLRPIEKKRVAAYVRVSTFHEEQLHSLEAQSDYFRKYITEHDNWELVDIYADNGVSVRSVRNRQRFLQMIQDCMDGKIDMVILFHIYFYNTRQCCKFHSDDVQRIFLARFNSSFM